MIQVDKIAVEMQRESWLAERFDSAAHNFWHLSNNDFQKHMEKFMDG